MALGAAPAQADVTSETLYLDTYENSGDGASGPVSTSDVLTDGATYQVRVTGTFSAWKASEWLPPFVPCGTPEPAPQYPSPGRTNGMVGYDAEARFAVAAKTRGFPCASLGLPHHHPFFEIQMSNGNGFSHIEPEGGPYSSPQPGHLYKYELEGDGEPAAFRLRDTNLRDNYGRFRIEVTRNSPPDCSTVKASTTRLWPPNHKLRRVTLSGGSDPDGDAVVLAVTGVTQDEPLNGLGDGDTSPDAKIVSATAVDLRAERSGLGDGRVYRIAYELTDSFGAKCSSTTTVGVPHDLGAGSTPIDSGLVVNSLG
jgi:hypothetical protein